MKKRLASALTVLCLLLTILPVRAAGSSGQLTVSVTGERCYAYAYQVAQQVNALRTRLGLAPLTVDAELMETAMERAAECAVFCSHTRPNGGTCYELFPSLYGFLGENIAYGFYDPSSVMDGWTNSPGHYANMTESGFTAIGVGCFCVNGEYYWSQNFSSDVYTRDSGAQADQTVTAEVPVCEEYFQPLVYTRGDRLTLRVGQSVPLPLYCVNLGCHSYTELTGLSEAILTGGDRLVRLDGDALTLTGLAPGTASVQIGFPIGEPVTLDVTVEERFDDVAPDQWYYTPVQWAVTAGVTSGVSEAEFAPNQTCTKAHVLTFLWRAMGEPEPVSARCPFSDVAPQDYYYKAALWAYESGVTAGLGQSDTFQPQQPCTRAMAVDFLWRALGRPQANPGASAFSDVPNDAWYAPAVAWAVFTGVTSGVSETEFAPDTTCTRAHVVTFLWRALV